MEGLMPQNDVVAPLAKAYHDDCKCVDIYGLIAQHDLLLIRSFNPKTVALGQ
jgi:hypothetical protein|tara:strand:- start:1009 stop:1164 length:156 start_codon:yes stop_codon:yes gene_type:complete